MRTLTQILLALVLASTSWAGDDSWAGEDVAVGACPEGVELEEGPLVISRGEGHVPLVIPRNEELMFDVSIDLGLLGSPKVGEVAILSRVDPFHTLSGPNGKTQQLERGTVTAIAVGQYALYEVRDELSTQILPQPWPQFIYSKHQTGTENRRRELRVGLKDDVFMASYRSDKHCKKCKSKSHFVSSKLPWRDDYHCKDCKAAKHRAWGNYRSTEVAPGSVDMLSATMIARAMVAMPEVGESEDLSVLAKLSSWEVTLSRGEYKRQTVRAGKFDAVLVRLEARRPEGADKDGRDFSGLFGIHGTISMWFEATTGVPILIVGSVPAGPLTLDVRIELRSYSGTPPGFGRLR